MGELTVRGLDEAVLARLSRRAEAHGRTAEEDVAEIVRLELQRTPVSTMSKESWFERAAELSRETAPLAISLQDAAAN